GRADRSEESSPRRVLHGQSIHQDIGRASGSRQYLPHVGAEKRGCIMTTRRGGGNRCRRRMHRQPLRWTVAARRGLLLLAPHGDESVVAIAPAASVATIPPSPPSRADRVPTDRACTAS